MFKTVSNLSAINLYNKQLTPHFHIQGTLQTCKSLSLLNEQKKFYFLFMRPTCYLINYS